MVPPLWEGALLLFNPWTHGFFSSTLLKCQSVNRKNNKGDEFAPEHKPSHVICTRATSSTE